LWFDFEIKRCTTDSDNILVSRTKFSLQKYPKVRLGVNPIKI
jgi:hypothetical protein